jgi:HSP90 family molecular chaperone
VLFNQSVLTLGARIDDPTGFVGRLNDLLTALTDDAVPASDGEDS